MAATSSGRPRGLQKFSKGGTESSRKHHFESFTQRVAKLNIDPVRRARRQDVELDNLDATASFFRTGLEHWQDRNLSGVFTAFLKEVGPLCDSLAQILHYHQKIVDILCKYTEKRDALSLEPLLSLISHLAHDLGSRFEVHFARIVTLVASLGAKHPAVEVTEWSFTCLAWLFKYLSRLLVPDLRPIYNIMAPLLGKGMQKRYVTRFAAEAMSFLVRKAAISAQRGQDSLRILVDHVIEDLEIFIQSKENPALYQYGIMTVFADAIKGINHGIHTCGVTIYKCLCAIIESQKGLSFYALEIIRGVTVNIVHHTTEASFSSILDVLITSIKALATLQSPSIDRLSAYSDLIFTTAAVRKGSRIQDWQPILDCSILLLQHSNGEGLRYSSWTVDAVDKLAAITLHQSPLDLVIPKVRVIMESFFNARKHHFLTFCQFLCTLDRERFQSLISPFLMKYLCLHWQACESQVLLTVSETLEEYDVHLQSNGRHTVVCPTDIQGHFVALFDKDDINDALLPRMNAYLQFITFVPLEPSANYAITKRLRNRLLNEEQDYMAFDQYRSFLLGAGLECVLKYSAASDFRGSPIWERLCLAAASYGTMPLFLENVVSLFEATDVALSASILRPLIAALTQNLATSSKALRMASLRLLNVLHKKLHGAVAEVLNAALAIENSTLELQTARAVSMHVRQIASQYHSVSTDPWLCKAVPYFCFGLFSFKLSSLWDEAINALRTICENNVGEEIVSDIAFQWLDGFSISDSNKAKAGEPEPQKQRFTEFECTNLSRLDWLAAEKSALLNNADHEIEARFHGRHVLLRRDVENAPSHALRVFSRIPHVAEKRSRRLIPLFLGQTSSRSELDNSSTDKHALQDAEIGGLGRDSRQGTFSRTDYKAMINLLGLFTNPRVLFKSSEVFNILLDVLTNGDVEMQRSALKAVGTWKLSGVQPYMENLENLLDDSRFRDELSTFLTADDEGSIIQPEHLEELMPVLLRILYGRIVARSSSTTAKGSQRARRKAVLAALSRLSEVYIKQFLLIAFGSLKGLSSRMSQDGLIQSIEAPPSLRLNTRHQVGILAMVKDLVETLGGKASYLLPDMVNATLYCMFRATHSASSEWDELNVSEQSELQELPKKEVRQVGLQCLLLMFKSFPASQMEAYLPLIFSKVINPRLDKFAVETAQSVSGMLHLFALWASTPQSATYLVLYKFDVLNKLVDCLGIPSAKDEVRLFVIESILKPFISNTTPSGDHSATFDSIITYLLEQTGSLVKTSLSKQLLESLIMLVSLVAPVACGSSQVESLLEISDFLLGQPSQRVSPRSKGDLMQILKHFIPLVGLENNRELQERLFRTVSSLFGYFKDRDNRIHLCEAMAVLAKQDIELQTVASLCSELNSFSSQRIAEPDFDRRLNAFNEINEIQFAEFTMKQWRPIVYNMLFYIKDSEELAIRSNASYTLRRFVEKCPRLTSNEVSSPIDLLKEVTLPALRSGASEHSELVRAEILSVMAHLVRYNPKWDEVKDMAPLLVEDDEEASFFNNVLHIQHHRRLRALRRLASAAAEQEIRSSNIAHFFIPLLEHFIFDKAEDESANNLASEATKTIGALATGLEWPQLRATYLRLCTYINSRPELEKSTIKLIGVLIDAVAYAGSGKTNVMNHKEPGPNDENNPLTSLSSSGLSALAKTMPKQEKLTVDIVKSLLPALQTYLHEKDGSTVSLRVRVAVSAVKLLKILSIEQLTFHLPPLLTDLCNILRSRAQESRDMTRKSLVEISILIGPSCFRFIVNELRSSLARGYQLHVLSYTLHSILAATSPIFKPGDLDYCLPQIVAIIMDDIFGVTGQEKDAEEYISKMKEVKSSKSFDSMELIAKSATIGHVGQLIRPLQVLLDERLDYKMVKKIDELLRRIGVGLLRNEAVESRDTLIFCFEVLRDAYRTNRTTEISTSKKEDYRIKRYLIASKGAKDGSTGRSNGNSSYDFKLARFSLDVLRSVLHKYDSLLTPANISGFMPAIGDALLQGHEEVQTSALRLVATIIKLPLQEIDKNAPIYIAEAMKIIKNTVSTNSEVFQAALKLISAILRDRNRAHIKDSDVAYLLKRLMPDLEEPDRQGVTFNFLKAVIARKVTIPEVYEILDIVAAMMVTNQTHGARDLARAVYFQFLLNYPQGKDRLSKQLSFLVKNLDYKHAEGRQSVMEAIHLLLTKIGGDLVQELVGIFFVPLVMVTVNDENADCRKMAGLLLKELLEKADAERVHNFLVLLRTWLSQDENVLLTRVSLQTYAIYLDVAGEKAEKEVIMLQTRVTGILEAGIGNAAESDWEVLYFSLQLASKIGTLFPKTLFRTSAGPFWAMVRECLYFPHAWVKLAAAKLLGVYFTDVARTNAKAEHPELPFGSSGSLQLSAEEMIHTTRASLNSLKVPGITEELAAQMVRNLVFLGRYMGMVSLKWNASPQQAETDQSDKGGEREDDESTTNDELANNKTAVQYIFERLSALLRREPLTTRATSLIPKTASLQLLASLCSHLPLPIISQSLETILLPLHNLADPSIPAPYSTDEDFRTAYEALVVTSQEIMGMLQKKFGTTEYIKALSKVREGVKERREGRRIKRRLEAVTKPEKWGEGKRRKGERKREKRKERSGEERGKRRGW